MTQAVSLTETGIQSSVVKSRYNDLEFRPHTFLDEKGKAIDSTTPRLLATDGGDMFTVTQGGGNSTTKSFAVPDAPFLKSKIQGKRGRKPDAEKQQEKPAEDVKVVA